MYATWNATKLGLGNIFKSRHYKNINWLTLMLTRHLRLINQIRIVALNATAINHCNNARIDNNIIMMIAIQGSLSCIKISNYRERDRKTTATKYE